MKASFRMRVSKVKLKSNGAEISVVRSSTIAVERLFRKRAAEVFDAHNGPMAGYAIVVWAPDGLSTCDVQISDGSMIPAILVPEFVKLRLLGDRIQRWAIDAVEEA